MIDPQVHREAHRVGRIGWLRAAVLGANDGIVSTASLILGVATAEASLTHIMVAGIAGLVAGAMSMAAGEYVSVSSQADLEQADLDQERQELATDYAYELTELTNIYVDRGLSEPLARQVATQLMAHDALGAHARDELGLNDMTSAQPAQAALSSGAAFSVGAALPLLTAWLVGREGLLIYVSLASLGFLAALGAISARVGGAPVGRAITRVVFWGALAMAVTAGIGALLGVTTS